MVSELENRTLTSFDISIGTGLMLEALFKPTKEKYDPDSKPDSIIDLKDYDIHFINIRTLIRNIFTSMTTPDKDSFIKLRNPNKELSDVLHEEIGIIRDLYDDVETECRFYSFDYSPILKNTENNIFLKNPNLQSTILEKVAMDINKGNKKYKFDKESDKRVLITTHTALDLFNYKSFSKFNILESHTGKLKTLNSFNSKFRKFGKHDLSNVPFLERMMYIFGDSQFILPDNLKYRRTVLEAIEQFKWNFNTTEEKVKYDLEKLDKEFLNYYKNIKTYY